MDRWIDESVLRGRQPCFMAPGFWSGSASLAVITQRLTPDALASIHMCTCLREAPAEENTLSEGVLRQFCRVKSFYFFSLPEPKFLILFVFRIIKGGEAQSATVKKKEHNGTLHTLVMKEN